MKKIYFYYSVPVCQFYLLIITYWMTIGLYPLFIALSYIIFTNFNNSCSLKIKKPFAHYQFFFFFFLVTSNFQLTYPIFINLCNLMQKPFSSKHTFVQKIQYYGAKYIHNIQYYIIIHAVSNLIRVLNSLVGKKIRNRTIIHQFVQKFLKHDIRLTTMKRAGQWVLGGGGLVRGCDWLT